MKEKAIYIGAVVLTAIWGVAAPEGFAPFLLGFELLLALSMWILVQILAGKVEIVPEPAEETVGKKEPIVCLLYTSPSPRDGLLSRMPSSA